MEFEDEREKLFNEVWKEPMTSVAKRYGLSDNGLRKRCIKLEIPLPPTGHWAKFQAGRSVTPQPKLLPLKSVQQKIFQKDSNQYQSMALINIRDQTSEQLKELDGIELLTPESKESFLKWCSKIQVPKRIETYNPLIIDYQNEIAYRKARDEEHKFRDIFIYSVTTFIPSKVPYRENKAVLPISVSDKQANRAFRIIDTLINLAKELDGKVVVESGQTDNVKFILFKHEFSFQLTEIMVKRRSLLSSPQLDTVSMGLRPMYENIPSGMLEIEFKEILNYGEKDKAPKTVRYADSINLPIEKQLGEVFTDLFKNANETKIAEFIARREYEIKAKEQNRLREIEEENGRKLQELELQNRRKQHLIQNIDQQMEGWFKSQKLRKYIEELEVFAVASDVTTKKLLTTYIRFVRDKAENSDPIKDIINEVKAILSLNE